MSQRIQDKGLFLVPLSSLTAHRMEKEKEKRMSGESKAVTDKEKEERGRQGTQGKKTDNAVT